MADEQTHREAVHSIGVARALIDPRVLALAVVYFGAVAVNYGTAYFLPQIVKAFGLTNVQTGFVSAIPYVVGTIGMVWFAYRSDQAGERKGHAAVALALAALGIGLSTLFGEPWLKMLALSVGAFGVFAVLPVFWTLPTAFLSGAAAAAGIAVINSVGNLAGFFGPFVVGALKDVTGNYGAGLWAIAACAILGMIVVLSLQHDRRLEEAPPSTVRAR
jgi:cyanate permease